MSFELLRKRFSRLRDRFYFYPQPEPMPRTMLFWIACGLVLVAAVLFSVYFTGYMFAVHNAYQTNAEDFGIMDQAIWNTLHGHFLRETICNSVSDTNCGSPDGITRFAVHFEPILLPVSLFYLIWSNPKILFIIQSIVVASGAFPAFWLARLRLRSSLAGVAIALLYLLYPALQIATTFDFHAVTFTTAFLLFTLYFMYTRRTLWMFMFAVLSMACKEEIPLVILMFGLWSIVFQKRLKSGLGLVVMSGLWFVIALYVIMPHFSPTGHALLMTRYNGTSGILHIVLQGIRHPRAFLHTYITESAHRSYLQGLFAPAAYLPLLAPWVLVLALPSLAVNLFSSNAQMYSGLFQYNAEIVPVLIFSTIEAIVLILWAVRTLIALVSQLLSRSSASSPAVSQQFAYDTPARPSTGTLLWRRVAQPLLLALLCFGTIYSVCRADYYAPMPLPLSPELTWPKPNAHDELAMHFISMIPTDATVSAQSKLVPHMSQRKTIYMFPYQDTSVEYDLLDITNDVYPYVDADQYTDEVKRVLLTGQYGVIAAQDGYMLLKRGAPPPQVSKDSAVKPGPGQSLTDVEFNLPPSLCSTIYSTAKQVPNPTQATFTDSKGGSMDLIGFHVDAPSSFNRHKDFVTVRTYWRVNKPIAAPQKILFLFQGSDGKEYAASADVPSLVWCQTNTWQPGATVVMQGMQFNIQASKIPTGIAHLSMVLLPITQPSSTILDEHVRLPLKLSQGPEGVAVNSQKNALQIKTITITQ